MRPHPGHPDARVRSPPGDREAPPGAGSARREHPDSAVRVRNDLLRWIMGFSSLTRMGWELTNNGRLPSVL